MLRFTNDHLLGLVPSFFDDEDPRPAKEQLAAHYPCGNPLPGFKLINGFTEGVARIEYPGEFGTTEIYREIGRGRLPLTKEILIMVDHEWLVILQKDGSFEVVRVD